MSDSRPPDFSLGLLNKSTGKKGQVGVGWQNPDGSINIVLNIKVVLAQNDDEVMRLFPLDKYAKYPPKSNTTQDTKPMGLYAKQKAQHKSDQPADQPIPVDNLDDDDVPF
jgi:hypothetical protein